MSATRAMTPAEAAAAAGDERPETGPNGTDTAIGRVYPYRTARGTLVGVGGKFLKPGEARQAAAVLMAYADAAEPEPDPAEVRELARVLHAADCCGGDPSNDNLKMARAALLAGWKREASRD